ncbi:polycystin-1-like [Anomaloglossus baeobatrachus]|uniref:polycystin-1-like n=1 Tax=Anomaloglossus baeobatrachus TaxID=238106 RepID=UPI003F503155
MVENLSHNEIWLIDEFWNEFLPELQILDLSGNRVPCGCPLHRFISHLAAGVKLIMDPETENCFHKTSLPLLPCADKYVSCLRGPPDSPVHYSLVTPVPFTDDTCLVLCFRHGFSYYSKDDVQRCLCGSVTSQINRSCMEICSKSGDRNSCNKTIIRELHSVKVAVSLSGFSHFSVYQTSGFYAEASAPVQKFVWEFKDGSKPVTAVGGVISHKYSLPGQYKVNVKAEGQEPAGELKVTVTVPVHVAELQCPHVGQTGQSIEVWLSVKQGTHLRAVYGVHQQDGHQLIDESSCPRGGRVFKGDLHCYWLSHVKESVLSARSRCSSVPGGDLAYITSMDQLSFVQESFSGYFPVWINMSQSLRRNDTISMTVPTSGDQSVQEECILLPLIPFKNYRRSSCMEKAPSLCQSRAGVHLPDAPVYLVGIPVFDEADAENATLSSLHEDLESDIEVMLFPGLWFSHSGFPLSLEFGTQPLHREYQVRVQILRPFCTPDQHLLPPGCVFQQSPFATCHPHPLCNTTGVCPNGKQWCSITESCLNPNHPCSIYTSESYVHPPRYVGTPPLYSPVADIPLLLSPSKKRQNIQVKLSHLSYSVYPDDILSIQHIGAKGSFLHCTSNSDSLWRQSYITMTNQGWLKESVLIDSVSWVDDAVCDLHVLYGSEAHSVVVSPLLWGFQKTGTYTISAVVTNVISSTTATCEVNIGSPITDVQIVHPTARNDSLHLPTQEDNLVVISARSTSLAHVHWLTTLQSGDSIMQPECPSQIASSVPICTVRSEYVGFSWMVLHFNISQSTLLSIQLTNEFSVKNITIQVETYDAIQDLQIHTNGSNHIQLNQTRVFRAELSRGSSVTFTWIIDNNEQFSYKGLSYTVTFRTPGIYNLKVIAQNPVSSQEATMMLHVDGTLLPLHAEFFLFSTLLLVNKTHEMSLKLQLEWSSDVTISWDFGDGSPLLLRNLSPSYDLQHLHNPKEPLASLNITEMHLYAETGNYEVKVTTYQGGSEITCSLQLQIVSPLTSLTLEVDHSSLGLHTAALFSALCIPSSFAVTFIWDFGDESKVVESRDQQIKHVYKSVGSYKIRVIASNEVSHINQTLIVTIEQHIAGLQVRSNSPMELGTEITVFCSITQGTNITWTFDMGDGKAYINQSEASVHHKYVQWGNFTVSVIARNALNSAYESLSVQIYRIQVINVLPEITTSLTSTKLTVYLSMPTKLQMFHWDFGDESPIILKEGMVDVWHTYKSAGNYTVKIFMPGNTESDFYSKVITVEDKIIDVTINTSTTQANVSQLLFFYALVQPPPDNWHHHWYRWDFGLGNLLMNTSSPEVSWSYMFEGHYNVTVIVWNQVSQHQAWCFVTVQLPIVSLSLEHDFEAVIPRGVEKIFSARVTPEAMAQFTWNFGDFSPLCYGQKVKHIFQRSGNLTISVYANNDVSHCEITYSFYIQAPIVDLSLSSEVELAKSEQTINFYAILSSGDDVQYYWSVCETCPYLSATSNISHTFFYPGNFMVRLKANNTVSSAYAFVMMAVQEEVKGVSIWQENAQVEGYTGIGEPLALTAHVSKGSNLTFHWVLMPGPLESHDSSITIHPVELGELLAEVQVENALGSMYTQTRVQVIERISGVVIKTPTETVAIGTPLNLTVHVQSGTNIQFAWDFGEDALLLTGQNRSILTLSYLTQGLKVITVTVTNALSSATESVTLIIQNPLANINIAINGIYNNTAVPSRIIVLFCGSTEHGTQLFWEWRLSGFNGNFMYSTQNVSHIFKEPGIYEVSLRVHNSASNAMMSRILLVQDAIAGFKVNTGANEACIGQEVTFCPTIQYGTNVTFTLAFPQLNLSQFISQTCGRFSFPSPGIYEVMSSAYNKVSIANYIFQIKVLDNIKGVKILGLFSAWPVMKTMKILAEVESSYHHSFQWVFQQEAQPAVTQREQRVEFTPLELGTLHIVLNVSNQVCYSLMRSLVIVQEPVTHVTLQSSSNEVFLHQCVTFKAIVSDGSDLNFQWTFRETNITGVGSSVEYCYNDVGEFLANVTVFNLLSIVYAYRKVTVRAVDCELPLVWLVESPSVIYRADGGSFEASVNLRNCYKYKIIYQWQLYRRSDNHVISLPNTDMSNALLTIPGHSMDIGMHSLLFTVTLQGTPLTKDIAHIFEVSHSLLMAQIHGGSKVIWPAETDLTLDGSKSYDPDQDDSDMKYEWSAELNTEDQPCFLNSLPSLPTITVIWSKLCGNISYSFTLTILKPGRIPSTATQTVLIHSGSVLPVLIRCISCDSLPSTYIINKTPVILVGECDKCHNDTVFRWSAVDSFGNPLILDKNTTTTGSLQRQLIIRKGVVQDPQGYTVILHVMQQKGSGWGECSIMLTPNHPPTGGQCSLHSQSTILWLNSPLGYNCTGWKDPDMGSQLFYLLSVHTCSAMNCRKLFLYRGLKSSHSVWVPAAAEGGNIQIYMEVEDMQGGRTLALNRSLSVIVPILYQEGSKTQWLRNHSESMLEHMQVVGDSTLLLQYALDIISSMKMNNTLTSEEHKYRIHLRNRVTDALCSRNLSTLWEVAAFSAALTHCVDHQLELDKAVLLKVLNFTEKMIHVMNIEGNKGQRVETDIQENILTVLGEVMAAQYSDALSLFAFNLTRDFTITLGRSHMAGEEPLLVNVPGIKIQVAKVHPEKLLCSSTSSLCHISKLQALPNNLLDSNEFIQFFIELDYNPFPGAFFPNITMTSQLVALEFTSPRGDSVPVKDLPIDASIKLRMPLKKKVDLSPISVFLVPKGSANFTVTVEGRTHSSTGVHLYIMVSIINGSNWSLEESPELLISYEPIYPSNESDTEKSHVFRLTLTQDLEQNLSLLLPSEWSWPISMLEYQVNVTSLLSTIPVNVSVSLFSSLCQYFDMPSQTWRTEGVTPSNASLPHEAVCQTNHLTLFGASIFVPPHQLILLPPAPRQWSLVLVCCLGFLSLYLLLVLISHKLDYLDILRVGTIPLCGPAGQYRYWVLVKTGWRRGAGTTAHVGICLYGVNKSGARHLHSRGGLITGNLDMFQIETDCNLGEIWKIRVWHDNTGLDPSWFLQYVAVWDKQTDFLYFFVVNDWLSVDNERNGGRVEKEILATCPQELASFSQVFPALLALGVTDWHLWLSVWWRPAHSRFTRIQRVTCCVLTFHLYMITCSLWYGAAGVQGESLPLGFQSMVTWQSVCVGIVTSVLVLPVQLLFSFLFRETRSLVFVEDAITSASTTEEEVQTDSSSILSIPGRADSLAEISSLSCKSITSSKFTFDLGKDEFWHLERKYVPLLTSSEPFRTSSCDSLSDARCDITLESRFSFMQLLCQEKWDDLPGIQSSGSSGDDPLFLTDGSNCSPHFTLSEENLLKSVGQTHEWKSSESDSGRFSPHLHLRSPSTESGYSHMSENAHSYVTRRWSNTDQYVTRRGSVASLMVSDGSSNDSELQDCWDISSASPSSFNTRIGVRWKPVGWVFSSGMLWAFYIVSLMIIAGCVAVTVLYISSLGEHGFSLWIISCMCAVLASLILLEPLRVVLLSLYYAVRCPPVLSEGLGLVEEPLVKKILDQCSKVRAPGGFSLLQAKEEARRVRALKTMIRSCTGYMIFLMLVLMMNFQSTFHDNNIRLLHSTLKRSINRTTNAAVSYTTIQSVSDLWYWLDNTLPAHLYNDPRLTLLGSPRLCQYNSGFFPTSRSVKFFPSKYPPTSWENAELCTNLTSDVPLDSLRCMESPCQLLGSTIKNTKEIIQILKNINWINKSNLELEIAQYHKDVHLHISTILQLNLLPHDDAGTSRLTVLPFHLSVVNNGLILPMLLASSFLFSAFCFLYMELAAIKDFCSTKASYSPNWTQVIIGLTSAVTGFLHFARTWLTKSVIDQYQESPWSFISLYDVAMLSRIQVALSAFLLFLVMIKVSLQLRFVRRWSVFGKTFQKLKLDVLGCLVFITILFLALIHCVSVVSIVKGSTNCLHILQYGFGFNFLLKRIPLAGSLFGCILLMVCRGFLCGLVLSIHRSIRAEIYRPALELQDHEMIDFLVKRFKLWLGVSKVKEYRHKVKFEGLDSGLARSFTASFHGRSRTVLSKHSFQYENVASPTSPRPLVSPGLAVDHLPTAVTNLLEKMDKVTNVLREVCILEQKLKLWQTMQKSYKVPQKEIASAPDNLKEHHLPRTYSTFSESALTRLKDKGPMSDIYGIFQKATPESASFSMFPTSGVKTLLTMRRPHSEERSGVRKQSEFIVQPIPPKRRAWDSEKPEDAV